MTIEKEPMPKIKIEFYLDKPSKEKEKFVGRLIEKITYDKDVGYAGYKGAGALKKVLLQYIYGHKQEKWTRIKKEDIKEEIENVFDLCKSIFDRDVRVFVFPTIDSFIIEKMGGIAGFTSYERTILLFVHKTIRWEQVVKETVGHELAHALTPKYYKRSVIQDRLVFEGLAEHFREQFIGGKRSMLTTAISKREAKAILVQIKRDLQRSDYKLYCKLFYGTGKYPRWAGYAIGYHLVRSYLTKLHIKEWGQILKTPPSKIISDSDFI